MASQDCHQRGSRLGPPPQAADCATISDGDGDAGYPEPSIEEDPTRGLSQQDLRQELNRALDRLTPTIRTTFVLFAEAGLSYKEIAETQEVPIGTVMSRIHAAREKLQAELDWGRLKDF